MKSIALQQCNSLNEVVDLINRGGSSEADGSLTAAQYIVECMRDNCDLSENSLDAHYDILKENGAEIDYRDVFLNVNSFFSSGNEDF